jgi:hypothetical protein
MLSEEEIKEAEKLAVKNPTISKLLDIYNLSIQSPSERLRNEMKEMAAVIAEDFKIIRTDGEIITAGTEDTPETSNLKILGSNKDDKLFERIMAIFDKSHKIYDAIAIVGEEKEKQEEGSFTDRKADKKRNA